MSEEVRVKYSIQNLKAFYMAFAQNNIIYDINVTTCPQPQHLQIHLESK